MYTFLLLGKEELCKNNQGADISVYPWGREERNG